MTIGKGSTLLLRALLVVAALCALWTIWLALTGGFVYRLAGLRISSRSMRNPAVIAAFALVGAWALATPEQRRRALAAARPRSLAASIRLIGERALVIVFRPSPWLAPIVAGLAAVAITALALLKGAFVAGSADCYGYVSQAHLWANGTLEIDQAFVRDMSWPFAAETFAPLGYVARPHGTAIVPVYSPGLPMLMAVFELIAGRHTVFYVVPILGGLAVWATYLMGTRLSGRLVGVSAAILLATSPPFVYQVMFPMSDVPVTAWWALALALVMTPGRRMALAAGLVTGVAILTRPNLVPLAAIPGALLLWDTVVERSVKGRAAQRVFLFAAGSVPACITVALLNNYWYGSPFVSGYGTLDSLYGWEHLGPNLDKYPRWLLAAETPIVLLALAAPIVLWRRPRTARLATSPRAIAIGWICFIAAVFTSYIFYIPFDEWWYLRFVLPAFPPMLVLASVVLVAIAAKSGAARVPLTAVIVAMLAWRGFNYAADRSALTFREGERKYVAIGEYIARKLPDRAVFLAMQESGSVRYYSGRLTIRYDWIRPNWLDAVIRELRARGYHPYIVLEEWEEPEFKARFKGQSPLAALDWPPVVWLKHSTNVRIYDPAQRDGSGASSAAGFTDIIR
jgi:4-amino-4-deoxy-L-arabinose transferase-like glycosyltransferase